MVVRHVVVVGGMVRYKFLGMSLKIYISTCEAVRGFMK